MQLPDGDFNQLAADVLDFMVDGFGVDLTETVALDPEISLKKMTLSAGVLNAWSSLPEDLEIAAKKTREAVAAWNPKTVYVTTNSQLFYTIPNKPAIAKIAELEELAWRLSQ